MTSMEKMLCSEILRDATSATHKEFDCEGVHVIQYDVICDEEKYTMTKHNGEWVYIHHWNKKGVKA
jgi:hypothetical protein